MSKIRTRTVTIPQAEYRALKEKTVTIPQGEYQALRAKAEASDRAKAGPAVRPNPGRGGNNSPFRRDQEVVDFIVSRLGKLTLLQIKSECLAKFGEERTPSKTAIHHFWQQLNGVS